MKRMTSGLSAPASRVRKAALGRTGSVLAALIYCGVSTHLPAQTRTVDTPLAVLRLSENNGDLIGVGWKNPSLEVIGESRLGENFRIVPAAGRLRGELLQQPRSEGEQN